jgi:uncharacterized protein Yka (UPF0111/DUF47 family)
MLEAMLVPQGRRFFDPLADAARHLVEAATLCWELYDRYPEAGDRLERIQALEAVADAITAGTYERLHRTFVTPIEREDLLALARALDDVCDLIEEAATQLDVLRVPVVPERARAQARILLHACERIMDAVERVHRLPDLSAEIEDVYALEDEGDRVVRDALARLFASGEDPLSIIRVKGLHDALERAIDATKTTARVLEAIVLKNR